eukprot:s1461_g1.t1
MFDDKKEIPVKPVITLCLVPDFRAMNCSHRDAGPGRMLENWMTKIEDHREETRKNDAGPVKSTRTLAGGRSVGRILPLVRSAPDCTSGGISDEPMLLPMIPMVSMHLHMGTPWTSGVRPGAADCGSCWRNAGKASVRSAAGISASDAGFMGQRSDCPNVG